MCLWRPVCACSVFSKSLWPLGLQPTRSLWAWDSPGRNTGVGCHSLLQGVKLPSLTSLALGGGFFTTSATWEGDCLLKDKIFMLDMVEVSLCRRSNRTSWALILWDLVLGTSAVSVAETDPGPSSCGRADSCPHGRSVSEGLRAFRRRVGALGSCVSRPPSSWKVPGAGLSRAHPLGLSGGSVEIPLSGSAAFAVCYTPTFPLKLWGRRWKRFRGLQLRRCVLSTVLFLPKWHPPLPEESRLPESHSWARRSGEARWQGFLEVSCFV